jgi:hypothetical protein
MGSPSTAVGGRGCFWVQAGERMLEGRANPRVIPGEGDELWRPCLGACLNTGRSSEPSAVLWVECVRSRRRGTRLR